MLQLALRDSALDKNTARLRALRLAREAEEAAAKAHRTSAAFFWDNIDTSGGVDACHPWTGERKWNHTIPGSITEKRYEHGVFEYEGCVSRIVTRVLCFATFGREVPRDHDVTPICGDHLCANVKHLAITPHGGGDRLGRAVPAEEFFCNAV